MVFLGEPLKKYNIKIPSTGQIKSFTFDENGRFETHNRFVAYRLKSRGFKKAEDTPPSPQPQEPQAELRHCKKCDFACASQGELLVHYRKQHPKEK